MAVAGDLLVVAQNDRLRVLHLQTQEVLWQIPVADTRITALEFRTVGIPNLVDAGRFLWVGFKDGSLHEYDLKHRICIERLHRAHNSAVTHILRDFQTMWTLDEGGNLHTWPPACSLKGKPLHASIRTVPGIQAALAIDGKLWIGCGRTVHVYHATGQSVTPERGVEASRVTGLITSAVYLRHDPDKVYFSHDDGKVTVYATDRPHCIDVLSISHYNISALLAVGDYLWTSFKTGKVFVYDVHCKPWRVMKEWPAHKSPITELCVDRGGLWKEKRLGVCSVSADGIVKVWDGLMMTDWLDAEMQKRIASFSTFREVRAVVCTWNAGASVPSRLSRDYEDSQFIENMIREAQSPDMIVFGFQELVDLDNKGKASRSVAKGFFGSKKKEDKLEEKALAFAYQQWQNHLEKQVAISSTDTYQLIQVKQLVGLFSCVFVKESLLKHTTSVDATVVKTGLKGRYGNKGGIIIRMTLDDTSICFVNCHLAAGQKHVMARNNDIFSILDQAALPAGTSSQLDRHVFSGGGDGSMVLDHEVCILNGDLNYRINGRRTHVIQQIKEGKLSKLLEADQLLIELKRNPTHRLRSFQEQTIRFPPTYKYDPGSDQYDTSEKARVPAWCDRIYYRGLGGNMSCTSYKQHTCRVSDHRPVSALLSFQVKTVDSRISQVYDEVAQSWIDLANKTILSAKLMVLKIATGCSDAKAKEALKRHGYSVPEAAASIAVD
ncbi:Endonuclease/exonuclease/phosphatase [Protomyces lactucae-debilis]|uniref:Endonuclease/exonuclease/phosphatase n=1 Tax=Protomyces lactucae-debilis TaxID=2754530 RepID=A0A1Y2F4Y2_PROLT|nr:Endonuclease/exonuclease/phosphatase [Protomyces lactucae-debilis]ORY78942.1 Endonuclease/exonuclease/phosphatase [Protomyces lactucae-debilis]